MNLMIDIETLGIKNDAPVVSLGAVLFDKKGIHGEFYIRFDVEQQIDSGKRKVDGQTIKWWMSQENAAQKVFSEQSVDNITALKALTEFINKELINHDIKIKDLEVWGNGPTFDITIMDGFYEDYGLKSPWYFRSIRDMRTFKKFVYDGSQTKRVGTHHNALDDAIYQAQIVIDGMNGVKSLSPCNGPKPEIERTWVDLLPDFIKGLNR